MSILLFLVRRVSRARVQPVEARAGGRAHNPNQNGDITMRFLMLVKHGENPGPPPKDFLDAMAKLGEEAAKSGTMLQSGGLSPIAKSTCVRLSRGQVTAIDGPFSESKEVVGGFAMFELKSKEEAIEAVKNQGYALPRVLPLNEGPL